jgi:hypothetical protein
MLVLMLTAADKVSAAANPNPVAFRAVSGAVSRPNMRPECTVLAI